MNLLSIKEITDKAINAFKRFPITLTWVFVGSFFCMLIINNDSNRLFHEYAVGVFTFILGVSWFISTRFLIENLKNPKKWEWLKLVTLGLLLIFYWHLPNLAPRDVDPKFYIRITMYIVSGHLFVLFAPFVTNWNSAAYWNYLKHICIAIGRSILFSGVLYLGLVLALLAVKYLFDVDIDDKRYGQLFVFCLGIVNTWTYLADFPKDVQQQTKVNYNKALEVFVKYILIPLVILYLVILYAYSIKIVLAWNLPKGWVSNLVTALALLGFLVQIMINPIQKTIKSWTINRFYPWFYILLLPMIVLLFIAIFKRIGDYGITENRYFLFAIALWVLGITFYLLFSRTKQLKVLSISLFIISILSSFGFWGAFSVSKNSQVKQFEKVFLKAKNNNNMVSRDDYNQLESILDYLHDRKSISRLDNITGISIENAIKDTVKSEWNTYNYLDTDKLLDSLKIELKPEDRINSFNENYYSYYNQNNYTQSFKVTGFDYLSKLQLNNDYQTKMKIGRFDVRFNKKENQLVLSNITDRNIALIIPLKNKLIQFAKYGNRLSQVKKEELIIDTINDNISARLIITSLDFFKNKDSISVNNGEAFLLIKTK